MLYLLFDAGVDDGRCGEGLTAPVTPLTPFIPFIPFIPFGFAVEMFDEDSSGCIEDAGVDAPYTELRVEEDLVVGTVPLEPLGESEPVDDLSVLKLALERRLKLLKKGMVLPESVYSTPAATARSEQVKKSLGDNVDDHLSIII